MATDRSAQPGLKKDAVNFVSSVVIGVASTAPGYSLAATLGFIVAAVGLQSPAIIWLAFVPMLFVATAYLYMNKVDRDCGTTFAWVGKAMGPWVGWISGWAIIVADIIVMANLAAIAGIYSIALVNDVLSTDISSGKYMVLWIGVLWIAVMTWICWKGTELSATLQRYLLSAEVLTLAIFSIVALVKVYGGDALDTSVKPELSWFAPWEVDSTAAIVSGVLLAIFIYWGWDSAVTVNEETDDGDKSNAPGRSAVWSTVILVLIYLVVATAALSFGGAKQLADQDDVLALLANQVLGWWDWILLIAVLTSAAASTQTTILPTARTSLSMARVKAAPSMFGTIHPRNLTPSTSTLWMGALSIIWYVGLTFISEDILFDSIAALGLMIAFYYGLTGFACTIYYRKTIMAENTVATAAGISLLVSAVLLTIATLLPSNPLGIVAVGFAALALILGLVASQGKQLAFLLVGALPALGGLVLTYVFFRSCSDLSHPENSESGDSWLGVGPPLLIAASFLVLGIVLMLVWASIHPTFFRSKPSTFDGDLEPAADKR